MEGERGGSMEGERGGDSVLKFAPASTRPVPTRGVIPRVRHWLLTLHDVGDLDGNHHRNRGEARPRRGQRGGVHTRVISFNVA